MLMIKIILLLYFKHRFCLYQFQIVQSIVHFLQKWGGALIQFSVHFSREGERKGGVCRDASRLFVKCKNTKQRGWRLDKHKFTQTNIRQGENIYLLENQSSKFITFRKSVQQIYYFQKISLANLLLSESQASKYITKK